MSDKDLKASARRWAWEYMLCNAELPEHAQDDEYRAAQLILATTTPPTMADVEWDDEKHRGAGATDTISGKSWVMIQDDGDYVNCIDFDMESFGILASELTPNGKKYELHEMGETVSSNEKVGPDQKEHPETLRTAEDYKDAPVGTIVAHNGFFPYVKKGRDVWTDTFDDKFPDDFLSGISRQVLRWGWGE